MLGPFSFWAVGDLVGNYGLLRWCIVGVVRGGVVRWILRVVA